MKLKWILISWKNKTLNFCFEFYGYNKAKGIYQTKSDKWVFMGDKIYIFDRIDLCNWINDNLQLLILNDLAKICKVEEDFTSYNYLIDRKTILINLDCEMIEYDWGDIHDRRI